MTETECDNTLLGTKEHKSINFHNHTISFTTLPIQRYHQNVDSNMNWQTQKLVGQTSMFKSTLNGFINIGSFKRNLFSAAKFLETHFWKLYTSNSYTKVLLFTVLSDVLTKGSLNRLCVKSLDIIGISVMEITHLRNPVK